MLCIIVISQSVWWDDFVCAEYLITEWMLEICVGTRVFDLCVDCGLLLVMRLRESLFLFYCLGVLDAGSVLILSIGVYHCWWNKGTRTRIDSLWISFRRIRMMDGWNSRARPWNFASNYYVIHNLVLQLLWCLCTYKMVWNRFQKNTVTTMVHYEVHNTHNKVIPMQGKTYVYYILGSGSANVSEYARSPDFTASFSSAIVLWHSLSSD